LPNKNIQLLESSHTLEEKVRLYKKENEMLHMLFESPYHGVVFIDTHGIIQYVNSAFAAYNKLHKSDIIGHRYENFLFDARLADILTTQAYEPFSFFISDRKRKLIASRRPVYKNGKLAGALGQYLSVDPHDIRKNFGEGYVDIIARLQARDIMFNIDQAIREYSSHAKSHEEDTFFHAGINDIIGSSPAMSQLKNRVIVVSDSPSSVLLTGESGTGKELFAKAIHFHGKRSKHPLVRVNCAAIPEQLLESELFGYADGAFTGARKGGKPGKFELAHKGTIFLDEIGDMPLSMQAKFLRVLQEREVERIGSGDTISIDVRVISATNKDLVAMVHEGTFREDLYYRLNVVNLHIPPLRERKSDIPEMVTYLINELNIKLDRNILKLSPPAMELFLSYDWPGNVRELVNILEGAMNFCRSSIIEPEDLPFYLHSRNDNKNQIEQEPDSLNAKLDNAEKIQLVAVLKQCNGSRKAAAAVLEVSKTTLYRLMKKHKLL